MVRQALVLAVLLAGVFLAPALRAQPAAQRVDNRFLLIFDTSSNMKRRLPALQKALNEMLAAGTNGQLHSGNSIGVWTFDQDLHTGQFPLQYWMPENAPIIASNITKFVNKQHYSKKTGFDALQPLLNQVVHNSERLTVLIFCDGKGEIHGTPYDPGINKVFQERQGEWQEERLPIVIGLRVQHGQYTGCMVSFPPQPVNLPEFPPLPEVAQAPSNADASVSSNLAQSSVPSLIIVGTTITNHVPPPQPKPVANPPPMTVTSTPAPAAASGGRPSDIVPKAQTNSVPAQNNDAAPLTPAKAATSTPESPGIGRKGALAIGVAFLAGGLVVFMLRRAR
jgi:hypothetical protein